jgi:hypothetical protein
MARDFIGQALNLDAVKDTAITHQKSVFSDAERCPASVIFGPVNFPVMARVGSVWQGRQPHPTS